jgi:hypothetical protein
MGYSTAQDLANSEVTLEQSLIYHLQGNHFPSVPLYMVQPCIDAIEAYLDEDYERPINLPRPVYQGNKDIAPASAIVRAHHLDAWVDNDCDHEEGAN